MCHKLNYFKCVVCFLAPYVKVYVMEGKRCLVKKKTRTARRTLEPLYQQQLEFKVEFTGKTLQVNNEFAFFVRAFCPGETRSGRGTLDPLGLGPKFS